MTNVRGYRGSGAPLRGKMSTDHHRLLKGSWSLSWAFAIGALVGAITGAAAGWTDYGAFEIGYLSNHVLGGLFIFGFLFLAIAALRNWYRRNPV